MPPVPAYSSAAMLRCSVVGVPVTARNTPGQQPLPRPAGARPLAQCARGHPVRHHLAPADDLKLPRQGDSQRGVVMLG